MNHARAERCALRADVGRMLENRMLLNAAVFTTDYGGIQLSDGRWWSSRAAATT